MRQYVIGILIIRYSVRPEGCKYFLNCRSFMSLDLALNIAYFGVGGFFVDVQSTKQRITSGDGRI
jgi:hypothetical protein